MKRKVKALLALALTLALVSTTLGDSWLYVSAENAAETEEQADEPEAAVEEDTEEKPAEIVEEIPQEEVVPAAEEVSEAEPVEEPTEETPVPAEEPKQAEENTQPAGETPAEQPTDQVPAEQPAETPATADDQEQPADAAAPAAPEETPAADAADEAADKAPEAEMPGAEEKQDETVVPEESIVADTEEKAEETPELSTEPMDFEEQLDGITVKASVEAGILPSEVKMSVKKIESDEDAYAETEDALNQSDVEYDGFVALDVSFLDAEGKEVEPKDGKVKVSFELDATLFPEEVDAESFSVQHLAEKENEVEVQTVADTSDQTDGNVEVKENVMVADFEVESFSTFTITFTQNSNNDNELKFKIYDTDDEELTFPDGTTLSATVTDKNTEHSIKDMVPEKVVIGDKTYVYQSAFIQIGESRITVDKVECVTISGFLNTKNKIRLHVAGGKQNDFYTFGQGSAATVGLRYREEGKDNQTVNQDKELKRSKTATLNADGTYNLELTLSGEVGSINKKVPVDVLFIIDQSGSMSYSYGSSTRAQVVGDQVGRLTNALSNNNNLDMRYSVVTFSSGIVNQNYYKDAVTKKYWTKTVETIQAAATVANPTGGTNYQAGLNVGRTLLQDARPDAQKYVIFLSDGVPTYHYNSAGTTKGGGSYMENADRDYAYAEAGAITNLNGFFSIRVGNESGADEILQTLCDRAHIASEGSAAENFKNYAAADSSALEAVFNQIKGSITQILCTNVSLTDQLSDYVQPCNGASPRVTVLDENQKEVTRADGITASLNNGLLEVHFPSDYKLKPGYQYKVNLLIEPSDKAYEKYSADSTYPDKGAAETGTHAGENGFYSNDGAQVNYTYNGLPYENDYPMPVVQLQTGDLVIEKTITGLPEQEKADLVKKLQFKLTIDGKEGIIPLTAFTLKNGKYVYTRSRMKSGVTYKVEEIASSAAVDGYDLNLTYSDIEGTIEKDLTKTASFTNTYQKNKADLVIQKEVDGIEPEQVQDTIYTFTITAEDNTLSGTYVLQYASDVNKPTGAERVTFQSGSATVKIKGTGSVTVKDLPVGQYQIAENTASMEEIQNEYYWDGVTYSSSYGILTATQDGNVEVTNHYKKYHTLIVEKKVEGEMGDHNRTFGFEVKKNDAGLESGTYGDITVTNGTFGLKSGQSITIPKLKETDVISVTETDGNKAGYKTAYSVDDAENETQGTNWTGTTTKENTKITFINTKEKVIPTGIVGNWIPFSLILLAGFGMAVVMLLTGKRRKI